MVYMTRCPLHSATLCCVSIQEVTKRLPRRGDKDLLVWMPLKDEFDLASPLTSHYMENFRAGSELSCCDRDVTRQVRADTLSDVPGPPARDHLPL